MKQPKVLKKDVSSFTVSVIPSINTFESSCDLIILDNIIYIFIRNK